MNGYIILNARARSNSKSVDRISVFFDGSSAIAFNLEKAIDIGALRHVEQLFEDLMRFTNSKQDEDPTWGFSDNVGMKGINNSLKLLILNILPKTINKELEKILYFNVKNISK